MGFNFCLVCREGCFSLFYNFSFVRFSSIFSRFLEPEMVFDKGLKLDLVSTNSIIGRLTLQIYWCRWAFAAIPHGQQRHATTKERYTWTLQQTLPLWLLFIFIQKVHGCLFLDSFILGCLIFSHHGITVPHGLPMGFPWAHGLQAFILKGDSRSALRVTKESRDAQRHGIWMVKEAEKMMKKSGGLDSRE